MANFFISFTGADDAWAQWIGFVLEDNGYSVVLQPWDFRPGSNFVLEMQRASANCDRTLIVLSPDFLSSRYAASEWAAAFADDPDGASRKLLPVRVRDCQPGGILKAVVHIDLVGLDQDGARERLLAGVREGRSKPSRHPPFPGLAHPSPRFPGPTAPASAGGTSKTYRPNVRRRVTDLEKHEFIEQAFSTIKAHFKRGLSELGDDPHVHGKLAADDAEFTAHLFVDGGSKISCRVRISDDFMTGSITYAEGTRLPARNTCNEMLSLGEESGELSLTATMDIGIRFRGTNVPRDTRCMTPEMAADYLWRRFVSHLEL